MVRGLSEIARDAEKVWRARESLDGATDAIHLREAWESFLEAFRKGMYRLIKVGSKHTASKPWANRLKNEFTKNDQGLIFLREARNATEYGLEPSADYQHASVDIPGFGQLGGSVDFGLDGAVIIDNGDVRAFGSNARIQLENGVIKSLSGIPHGGAVQNPAEISLRDIQSETKNETFKVPTRLAGQELRESSPQEIAHVAAIFFNTKFIELQELLKK